MVIVVVVVVVGFTDNKPTFLPSLLVLYYFGILMERTSYAPRNYVHMPFMELLECSFNDFLYSIVMSKTARLQYLMRTTITRSKLS